MADMAEGTGKRAAYRSAEVCEIAHIQPYVLRSWETEFPRMGVVRGGARIYRQADLDQVLRIKQLVFEEGLTLAGARRRIEEAAGPQPELPLEEFVTPDLRHRIGRVRQGLRELLALLGGPAASGPVSDVQPLRKGGAAGDGKSAAAAHAAPRAPHKKKASAREKARTGRPSRRHVGRA